MIKSGLSFLTFMLISISVEASWLGEITGIHLDLNRGTLRVERPNLAAVPEMIQNLPKDVGQAMLNPNAPHVAAAIRFSRGQALNRGTNPIPQDIRQQLAAYFPPAILDKVRWTTKGGGITLDVILANWFGQEGAITLDEVIVFSGQNTVEDVELWAHEVTHVLQYEQLGVETFAFYYSLGGWHWLENQARSNASQVMASLKATRAGRPKTWGYEGQQIGPVAQLTWASLNQAAKNAISPVQCIWINNQTNMTGNECPVPIMVTGVMLRRFTDGYTFTQPCNQSTCLFPPNQSGPLLSPAGHLVIGVTAAYQW